MAPIGRIGRSQSGSVLIDTRPDSDLSIGVRLIPSVPGIADAQQWTITAAFTEEVDGFTEGDISLNFSHPDGSIDERPIGFISHFNFTNGSRNADFRLNLPIGVGFVDIICAAGAVTATSDSGRSGPSSPVVLVVQYNTQRITSVPSVEISTPSLIPYRDRLYPVRFTFSESVGGFALEDITSDMGVLSNLQPQNDEGSIYVVIIIT